MELATVITSSICEKCLYKTSNHLTNPICMSCTRISIVSKNDNFESKEENKPSRRFPEMRRKAKARRRNKNEY